MVEEVLDRANPFACDFEEEPHEGEEDRDADPRVEQDAVDFVRGGQGRVSLGLTDDCCFDLVDPGEEFICLGQSTASTGAASISRVDRQTLRTCRMSQGIADHALDEIGVIQVARVYGQNGDSQFLCEFVNGVFLAVLFRDINHGRNCNNRVPCLSDLPQQVQRTRHSACVKQNNGKIDLASGPRISEGPGCAAESIADDLLVG